MINGDKRKDWWANHYAKNKEKYRLASLAAKKQRITFVRWIKEGLPCYDCNERFPFYVMDFDHRDPSVKKGNIAKMVQHFGAARLLEELPKCDVVCANCHRSRTQRQRE
jgi:hypothetical protein